MCRYRARTATQKLNTWKRRPALKHKGRKRNKEEDAKDG